MSALTEESWRPPVVRYRIERVAAEEDKRGNATAWEWEIGIYRDGEWSGGVAYDTFAEAIAAYNAETRKKAER